MFAYDLIVMLHVLGTLTLLFLLLQVWRVWDGFQYSKIWVGRAGKPFREETSDSRQCGSTGGSNRSPIAMQGSCTASHKVTLGNEDV